MSLCLAPAPPDWTVRFLLKKHVRSTLSPGFFTPQELQEPMHAAVAAICAGIDRMRPSELMGFARELAREEQEDDRHV